MRIDIDKLLTDTALENGISKVHAEIIYRSIFEMIAETMREGEAENILLPRFGKFIVPRKKLEKANPEKFIKKYGTK